MNISIKQTGLMMLLCVQGVCAPSVVQLAKVAAIGCGAIGSVEGGRAERYGSNKTAVGRLSSAVVQQESAERTNRTAWSLPWEGKDMCGDELSLSECKGSPISCCYAREDYLLANTVDCCDPDRLPGVFKGTPCKKSVSILCTNTYTKSHTTMVGDLYRAALRQCMVENELSCVSWRNTRYEEIRENAEGI